MFISISLYYLCRMAEYKEIEMGDVGVVFMRRSSRARRYLLRVENGRVYATMPMHGSEREMLSFVNEQRTRLLRMIEKAPARQLLDENAELKTQTFLLRIVRTSLNNMYTTLKDGVFQISCPAETDFSCERIQKMLWKVIENALRHEGKRVLPERIELLAKEHGFSYAQIKINNSRTHWGSCTGRKNINLSLSVMLLPEYLSDYILLHELCHTVEMNHGERFWSLMNKVTCGKALSYRNELKKYRMLEN